MQNRHDGARFRVPAPYQVEQVRGGLGVDGGEGFVEQNQRRILQQQAGEQGSLHLPSRQRADGAALETGQANCRKRLLDAGPICAADPAENTGSGPQAHGDEIVDRQGECPVDLGRLRQIRDGSGRRKADADMSLEGSQGADDPFEQGRFAGAIGADHRRQAAGPDLPVEVMHGRVAPIAEGHFIETD